MSSKSDNTQFDGRIAVLQLFVNLINPVKGSYMTVTLNVKRTIIKGTMISMDEYYEAVKQQLVETVQSPPDILQSLRNSIKEGFDLIKISTEKENEENDNYNHIFLKDAKFYYGNNYFSDPGVYLVGKIDSVDGFVLGHPG